MVPLNVDKMKTRKKKHMLENAHWHFTSCLLSDDTRLEHGIHCSDEYNSFRIDAFY